MVIYNQRGNTTTMGICLTPEYYKEGNMEVTLKEFKDRVDAFVKYFGEDKKVSITSNWAPVISDSRFPNGVVPFFYDDEPRNETHENTIRRILENGKK